jgi:hypothetical protein
MAGSSGARVLPRVEQALRFADEAWPTLNPTPHRRPGHAKAQEADTFADAGKRTPDISTGDMPSAPRVPADRSAPLDECAALRRAPPGAAKVLPTACTV